MNRPEIIIVVARAQNGVIGNKGKLPWHLPADLRHFKQMTKGRPMIMGRKTFDSLPGVLEGRRHIVITRDTEWEAEEDEVEVVHSLEEALKRANAGHVCIIGGAEIYAMFMDIADRIELTEIYAKPEGDTKMPAFSDKLWLETARAEHPAEGDKPAYAFITLQRRS